MKRLHQVDLTRRVYDFVLTHDGRVIERMEMTVYPRGRGGVPWPLRTALLVLPTRAGDLSVRPMGCWVACRFSEPGRALEILDPVRVKSLNRTSGKWNFHFPGQHETADFAFAEIERAFNSIL